MAGRKMDASELAAAEIVAAYLEGRQEPRDVVTAPDGTHDFDIVLKDRRRVALEVTAAADHKRIAFDDRAFRTEWLGTGARARLVACAVTEGGATPSED